MRTSKRGIELIAQFEGYRGTRYLDAVGVPTIGFGTTAADIGTVPASCTREQAEGWLRDNLARKYEPAINSLGSHMNQNQFDALVSLAYNCGPGIVNWQIGANVRNKNMRAASADFMRYVYAGGQVLQGLVNRRAAERRLFDTPAESVPAPAPREHRDVLVVGDDREAFVLTSSGEVKHRWKTRTGWSPWASLGKP